MIFLYESTSRVICRGNRFCNSNFVEMVTKHISIDRRCRAPHFRSLDLKDGVKYRAINERKLAFIQGHLVSTFGISSFTAEYFIESDCTQRTFHRASQQLSIGAEWTCVGSIFKKLNDFLVI